MEAEDGTVVDVEREELDDTEKEVGKRLGGMEGRVTSAASF